MKKYSLSLTISYTEQDLKDSDIELSNEAEIQEFLEDEFNELISGGSYFDTEFTVEEVDG